jgi:hypothetical protein
MKTKIGTAGIALFFLMACGSSEQKQEPAQTETTAQSNKYIMKASNMMYVTIGSDQVLVANEPNPTKAETFEKMDLGNGKSALRASTGKYVSDDREKDGQLDVFREEAHEWETFEVIALDNTKVNIKSSRGKYVGADYDKLDGKLAASRDEAHDWEAFDLEPK